MIKRFLVLLMLLPWAQAAHADRITRMDKTELCTYVARLEVAAYHFFEKGQARADVKLHWHGDETENEVAFVNRVVDDAYAWLTSWKQSSNSLLSPESFGDMVFHGCMQGKLL